MHFIYDVVETTDGFRKWYYGLSENEVGYQYVLYRTQDGRNFEEGDRAFTGTVHRTVEEAAAAGEAAATRWMEIVIRDGLI
jgi:hypothetical protein